MKTQNFPAVPATIAKTGTDAQANVHVVSEGDRDYFQSLLKKFSNQAVVQPAAPMDSPLKTGLADKIAGRATALAGEIKKDHVHVSKLLETAAATGDQGNLIKAMLALNDYEMRVQFVSKAISKASTSVDQLTRMQ